MSNLWSDRTQSELPEIEVSENGFQPADDPVERSGAAQDAASSGSRKGRGPSDVLGCDRTVLVRAVKVLKVVAVATAATIAFALIPGAQASGNWNANEAKSASLLNGLRASKGLWQLADQAALDRIAKQHAEEMAQKNEIFHYYDIGSRADAAGVHWTWIGENVGVGPDVTAVHNAFVASPGHYQNMVYAPYNVVGVGVAVGTDGSVFVAHEFATVSAPAAAPAAPVVKSAPAAAATATPVAHRAARSS